MRTTGDRHRIPDICVTLTEPATDVLREPPYLAIEVLSSDDRMSRILEKLEEYASIGIPNIWVFDTRLRPVFTFHGNALQLTESVIATIGDPRLERTHPELFA